MRFPLMEKINPFLKGVTILICFLMLVFTKSWKINIAVFAVCMFMMIFLSKCSLKMLFGMLIPVGILAVAVFVSGVMYGNNSAAVGGEEYMYQLASMQSGLLLATRILAYVSMGILFGLTMDTTEFIMSLMHQGRIKPKFAYGVLAAFHLMPALRREWDEVNLAYRVRQKKTGLIPLKPLFNTLVNGIRWSENVAMAMESKGFDGDGDRTFHMVTKIQVHDIVYLVVCVGLMATNILFLR